MNGTVETITLEAKGLNKFEPMTFFKSKYDDIKNVIKNAIKENCGMKWYMSLKIKMSRRKGDDMETAEPHFRGKCQTALKMEDIEEDMEESIKKMCNSFIEDQRQGSNWTVDKVITIHMARYRPLRGSNYIPLPIKLRSKHPIINVKNKDNNCFMWSVLAALHPGNHNSDRVREYQTYATELNFDAISFLMRMADIPKFEKQNQIYVNVFGYEKGDVFPIHITTHRYDKHVYLLMTSDRKKSHFC